MTSATSTRIIKVSAASAKSLAPALIPTVIDSRDALEEILPLFNFENRVALNCAGANVSRDGKLSCLNIGFSNQAFVIDVPALGLPAAIKDFLENSTVEKIIFDGRELCDLLFHQHGLSLNGIIDLRLMEFTIREHLEPGLRLCNANSVLEEVVPTWAKKDWAVFSQSAARKDGAIFMQRPLSETALSYVALRLKAYFDLCDLYQSQLKFSMKTLKEYSAKFNMSKISIKKRNYSIYEKHDYMIWDVFQPRPEGRMQCVGCHLYFHPCAFAKGFATTKQRCIVCQAAFGTMLAKEVTKEHPKTPQLKPRTSKHDGARNRSTSASMIV